MPVKPSSAERAALNGHHRRKIILTKASTITPRAARWLWEGRIPLGGLSLLAGREGLGKSTISADRVARITKGTLQGEYLNTPKPVIICATEDEWSYTILPRLMVAGADLDMVFKLTVELADGTGSSLVLPVDTGILADEIEKTGAVLVVLDPIISRLSGKLDSYKDGEVRRGLEPIVEMSGDTGVSVWGIIHITKQTRVNALDLIMASKAFVAVPRSILMTIEHPDAELRALEQNVLFNIKNNLAAMAPPRVYEIAEAIAGKDPEDQRPIKTSKIQWLDELNGWTANEVLEAISQGKGTGGTKTGDAEAWLLGYLHRNDGKAEAGKAKIAGAKLGHKPRTLERAVARSTMIEREVIGWPAKTFWKIGDG